jgi:hypothetical protein
LIAMSQNPSEKVVLRCSIAHSTISSQEGTMDNAIDDMGLRRTPSNHIKWRKDHVQYPRNRPTYRKCYDIAIIVFFEFYTLGSYLYVV